MANFSGLVLESEIAPQNIGGGMGNAAGAGMAIAMRAQQEKDKQERLKRQRALETFSKLNKAGVDISNPETAQRFQEIGEAGEPGALERLIQISPKTSEYKQQEFEKKEDRQLKVAKTRAEISALGRKRREAAKSLNLTPGQKKTDEAFAKDFSTFSIQGGFADAQKGVEQLREVSQQLGSGRDDLTGGAIGALPDFVRKRVLPQSAATQQAVEEVVQRNLRVILGAQFTEKEGTRLIERAFDPSLGEAENKKRVDRLLNQMQTALEAKQAASEYFRQNGTLAGFQGKTDFRPDDFDPTRGMDIQPGGQQFINEAVAAPQENRPLFQINNNDLMNRRQLLLQKAGVQ